MGSIPRFYVYILSRPDGRPFYVGKGQGNRIDNHETAARRGVASKCCNIIRKIWRLGGEVAKQKVFWTDDEHDAFEMERRIIAAIGRENLANNTDGGDGASGWEPTQEWHEKVQAAKIGKPRSEACKAKLREKLTGVRRSPDAVKKGADAIRGRSWSERARQNILEGMRKSTKVRPHGEAHHRSKWTVEQVREIRRLYKDGIGPTEIARRMGMSKGAVSGIVYSKRAWKWLDSDDGNIPT